MGTREEKLKEIFENEELFNKLLHLKSGREVQDFLSEHGVEMTMEEIHGLGELLSGVASGKITKETLEKIESGELSEEELEEVSGGGLVFLGGIVFAVCVTKALDYFGIIGAQDIVNQDFDWN